MTKYIILGAVLALIVFGFYLSQGLARTYRKEVRSGFSREAGEQNATMTEEDIQGLPAPVQKYLRYVGVIGREKVRNVKMAVEGEMKLDEKKGWVKIKAEQYNFYDGHPTRLFYITTKMFGIPVYGLHSYTDAAARMLIKAGGLVAVLDAKGREMRISDTTTLLNDMACFAPATLVDPRIQWEAIDDLSAKATFTTNECTVSAILYFNEQGELINFVSDDRYYMPMDGSSLKATWSTPLGNYQERDGLRLAIYGEAIWSLPEGDYCYAKFDDIQEVKYNCEGME